MKTFPILLSFLIACYYCHAQDYPRYQIDIQNIIDDAYGYQEEVLNYDELYENLLQFRSHPKNLNKIDADGLLELHVLTPAQIQSLLTYRANVGEFVSIYELQAVPDFDLPIIYKLIPFVFVPDPSAVISRGLFQRIREEGDHYLLLRYGESLQRKAGFTESDSSKQFKGSTGKLAVRLRSSRPGDFSFGLSFEKDEGEPMRWSTRNKQYGFDYSSFHLQLVNKGRLKNIILGDFQVQFGQGLVLGGGFGMGKGGETITSVRKSNIGLLPYTSFYEAGAFRGIAATVELSRKFIITNFVARNNRDARVVENEDAEFITTLQTTGLHRNEKEMAMRKQSTETNAGIVLQFKHQGLEAGIISHYLSYDKPLTKKAALYNQFSFSGKTNLNNSIYLNYNWQNISFFSEIANSMQAGSGFITGVLASLHPTFDLSLVGRFYQRNYHALYGNALAENTTAQNEQALYWGWKYRMNRRWTASGYIDLFVFPWIKFRNYQPSRGSEWLAKIDYTPNRKVKFFVQFRQEEKSRNQSNEGPLYISSATRKQNWVVSSVFGIGQKLRLQTRLQGSNFKFNSDYSGGIAVMQDISFEAGKFEFSARYALFDTDDFDNRQYAYEKDVLLAYSLPSYYGRGVRHLAMLEYKVSRSLTLWFRYTQTRYAHREEIGTDLEMIKGDLESDVKFQARLKF
ncbi:ComEA family DNA-binding protein [Pseudochryseolinea flava]|uniref:Helix-hairpin-helix domain-containing protein n=1 Tax=Pseudochryseolinea flava TaxID=2059302 RepID=A0A364XWN9_9BACT|nr:helix-hairpin-helix domain-containing protein [Pseudochryseolinea flava]RAV98817.1 helix-hairpin-helix domain-containing protein [Pseudochryseolinea flava]